MKEADEDGLARFVEAQQPVYEEVLAELEAGRKETHWIWFVFPQLRGLGASATARYYGIADLEEARAYLAHPVLGPRLREATLRLLAHEGSDLRAMLGSPDDLKFRSCMTLFREASTRAEDRRLFQRALDVFCEGRDDGRTLALLTS